LKDQYEELKIQISKQDFWDDMENAQKILKNSKILEKKIEEYESLKSKYEDILVLFDFASQDSSFEEELTKEMDDLEKTSDSLSISIMLNEQYDSNNAILSVHSGTGGLDAQDWTQMLLRMYTRFASNMGFKISYIDLQQDDQAGVKSATIKIDGENAYGYLKCEKGVHRLVRISPFDSS